MQKKTAKNETTRTLKIGDIIVCRGCNERVVVGGRSHICPAFMAKLRAVRS